MNDAGNIPRAPQNISLSSRSSLVVTGVEEVVSCDAEIIVLRTLMGELSIAGMQLHMGSFNRDSGEFKAEGKVKELIYKDIDVDKGGFFSRLFR